MAGKAAAGPAERLDVKLSTLFLLICGLDNWGRLTWRKWLEPDIRISRIEWYDFVKVQQMRFVSQSATLGFLKSGKRLIFV